MKIIHKVANAFTSAVVRLDMFPGVYNRSRSSLPSQPRRNAQAEAPRQTQLYDCWMCGDAYKNPMDYLQHIKECAKS